MRALFSLTQPSHCLGRGRNKAPAMVERPMPLSAPASLGRPPRPESFIPGPDTCGNAPWPSATPNSASPFLFLGRRPFLAQVVSRARGDSCKRGKATPFDTPVRMAAEDHGKGKASSAGACRTTSHSPFAAVSWSQPNTALICGAMESMHHSCYNGLQRSSN